MAIRLRDLAPGQRRRSYDGADRGMYATALPRSMLDDKPPARRRGRFALCRFLIAYAVFFALLLSTWRHWHEQQPYFASKEIGWQANSVIGSNAPASAGGDLLGAMAGPGGAGGDFFGPAFPLDKYNPLLPNTAPLADMTIETCYPFSPCMPASDRFKDDLLGPWVRVARPLDSLEAQAQGAVNAAEPSNGATGGGISDGLLAGLLGGKTGGAGALSQINSLFEQRWLFYRRSRDPSRTPRVVDVRIVEQGQTPPDGNQGWHRVKNDIRVSWQRLTGQTGPAHLYFRTEGGSPPSAAAGASLPLGSGPVSRDSGLDALTEVDIIYGPNQPLPGFKLAGLITSDSEATKTPGAQLAVRRKPLSPPELPPDPLFRADGTFKILQLADLHYSVEHEPCRDVRSNVDWKHSEGGACKGDLETIARVEQWLDAEKPDLVVLSGDQLNGQRTSWDERSTIMKVVQPMIDRKIMWAAIMGNHESQSGFLSRRQLQSMLHQLPYSKTFVGPEGMHGASNFYLHVHAPTPDKTRLASLYFMDTGTKIPKKSKVAGALDWLSSAVGKGKSKGKGADDFTPLSEYDYVHQGQINWFKDLSAKNKKIVRPYEPDGATDLDKLWDRAGRNVSARSDARLARAEGNAEQGRRQKASPQTMRKPTGIVFQHIPLPEAFNNPDLDKDNKPMLYGERHEIQALQGGQGRSGFFDALFPSAPTSASASAPGAAAAAAADDRERDVQLVVHGHQHLNEDCRRVRGVWLCFGGGSSFAGYGSADLQRRARVIALESWGERIASWHRYDDGSKGEAHTLYDLAGEQA